MSSTGVRLQVSGLKKDQGEFNVLNDINFDIEAGTFLTLLGPSGCGKSTTLRLLAGLDQPTSGKILIDGKDVTGLEPSERGVGMVFQNYALFPHMSVRKNILYGMNIRKEPAKLQNKNLARVSELMGLDSLLNRLPSQLSGGQQQRVALARVLVANRKLVLMDEPLSNLDAKLRVEIRSEILELNKELGLTMVYVTHDQSEALSMSDKILLMDGGEVSQFGTPFEMYNAPQNDFVASFIGTPPMNLIEADKISRVHLGSKQPYASNLQVGIRPEDILIKKEEGQSKIKGLIKSVEYEGVNSLVIVDIGDGKRTIVSVPKLSNVKVGSEVNLEFNEDALHFFSKNTGKRFIRV
ncbi:ABC transporter ATP-binding protein [Vibrio sp. VB16]|uniref:ABC transporter ATP-binding protein n=1 Tax=Vibrio sp. VB16 TaxID=2785746 RepID=UPI00189D13F4|nr:ABC transporter ATP-binding protein [Vibrio sp. VB16]UGA53679.1 ABC transporter ATP-binding protein [Vibrio sp. VB16]